MLLFETTTHQLLVQESKHSMTWHTTEFCRTVHIFLNHSRLHAASRLGRATTSALQAVIHGLVYVMGHATFSCGSVNNWIPVAPPEWGVVQLLGRRQTSAQMTSQISIRPSYPSNQLHDDDEQSRGQILLWSNFLNQSPSWRERDHQLVFIGVI